MEGGGVYHSDDLQGMVGKLHANDDVRADQRYRRLLWRRILVTRESSQCGDKTATIFQLSQEEFTGEGVVQQTLRLFARWREQQDVEEHLPVWEVGTCQRSAHTREFSKGYGVEGARKRERGIGHDV